jgi:hypothetical protein
MTTSSGIDMSAASCTDVCVAFAAQRLYDAECALHIAHQSQVDAWIAAADAKLHDAISAYLAALTDRRS